MDYYPAFAQLLNQHLQAQERTPTWLAKRLRLNPSTVNRWLNHEARPSEPAVIGHIADLLGLPTTEHQALLVAAGYGYQVPLASTPPQTSPLSGLAPSAKAAQVPLFPRLVDWGEAPDVSHFQGRHPELAQLHQWLVADRCRLVAVLGMGGLGKTVLATMAVAQVEHEFAAVIWRSLRNAPPVEALLGECIEVLSHHQVSELPPGVDKRITLLIAILRQQRCLLVLDNYETVLQSERAGHYLRGYEGYGQFLQRVGEGRHQSCLLLTSREKPKEVVPLEGVTTPVRTLALASLEPADARALLEDKGLVGSDNAWAALHVRYSGHPLALKLIAERFANSLLGLLINSSMKRSLSLGVSVTC